MSKITNKNLKSLPSCSPTGVVRKKPHKGPKLSHLLGHTSLFMILQKQKRCGNHLCTFPNRQILQTLMARSEWDVIGWFYYYVWWAYLFSLIPLIICSFFQSKTSPASDILHFWPMPLLHRNLLSFVCRMGMTPIKWRHYNELTGMNYATQYKILKQQNNFHFYLSFPLQNQS